MIFSKKLILKKNRAKLASYFVCMIQIYRHCADLDTSSLKDPRLHDGTKISCLYNLGRLLNDDGRSEVRLYMVYYM